MERLTVTPQGSCPSGWDRISQSDWIPVTPDAASQGPAAVSRARCFSVPTYKDPEKQSALTLHGTLAHPHLWLSACTQSAEMLTTPQASRHMVP